MFKKDKFLVYIKEVPVKVLKTEKRWLFLGLIVALGVWGTVMIVSGALRYPEGDSDKPADTKNREEEKLDYIEEEGYWKRDGSRMERKEIDDPHVYTYYQMVDDLREMARSYPYITELMQVGSSVEGVPLWCLQVGRGDKDILVVGAAHAREWITTPVLVEQARTYARAYYQPDGDFLKRQESQLEISLEKMLQEYTIWFIPMLNPDGVRLVQKGVSIYPHRRDKLLSMNKPGMGEDFSRWKANIRGVDLNKQYDITWEETRQLAFVDSRREVKLQPSWQNYMGEEPFSEPEARAIGNLLNDEARDFRLGLDYHSSGQFIFWYHGQEGAQLETNKNMVEAMSDYSGYGMMAAGSYYEPNTCLSSYLILEHGLPGATVEITPFSEETKDMRDYDRAIRNNIYMIPAAVSALDGGSNCN